MEERVEERVEEKVEEKVEERLEERERVEARVGPRRARAGPFGVGLGLGSLSGYRVVGRSATARHFGGGDRGAGGLGTGGVADAPFRRPSR